MQHTAYCELQLLTAFCDKKIFSSLMPRKLSLTAYWPDVWRTILAELRYASM